MLKPKKNIYKSSDIILNIKNIFVEEVKFNKSFLGITEIDKLDLIPNKGQFNFVTTQKSISSNKFIDLANNPTEIYLFFCKIDKKRLEEIEKYKPITILITTDEYSNLQGFKKIINCATHVKSILIKSDEGYISMIGSGNPSYNARIEQYQIFNSKAIFDKIKQGIC